MLDWDRKAEWNVYPADHIGRPARHGPGVSQTAIRSQCVCPADRSHRPWSDDISPMGSNDFRSTKRHIHWAAIHYADGPGVVVESDGRQHVRAFVETDRISVHVNDWYGGTGAGWPEWVTIYGTGQTVHKGERITSKLRLSICPQFPAGQESASRPLNKLQGASRTTERR